MVVSGLEDDDIDSTIYALLRRHSQFERDIIHYDGYE